MERARRTLCLRVLLLPTKQALLRRALGRRILLRRIRSVGCHQVNKTIEEVAGVVRPGGGLWVVLHRKGPQPSVRICELQALDHVVVETDVADFGDAVRGLLPFPGRGDRKPVIVSSDLDFAGSEVDHWLVDAAVPVPQLEGAEAKRPTEQLIAEAD